MNSRVRSKAFKLSVSPDEDTRIESKQSTPTAENAIKKRRSSRKSSFSTNTPLRCSPRIQRMKAVNYNIRSRRSLVNSLHERNEEHCLQTESILKSGYSVVKNELSQDECDIFADLSMECNEMNQPRSSNINDNQKNNIENRPVLLPTRQDSINAPSFTSASTLFHTDKHSIPQSSPEQFLFVDLPRDVEILYREKRNINDLYEWQKECLSDQKLLNGENMIISLPTGAGKTLIAEVLMLREAVVKKRSSILMLPYVAIVQEKVHSLSVFEEHLPLLIEEYAASKGRLPPIKRRNKVSLFVATIEKANMLINSLIEQDRINEIGLFVVDEFHMLGDGCRGGTIEQALTKFMQKGSGQIVGMSATLANLKELALFIRSSVFSTNFRPVELTERVKIDNTLYRVDCGGKLIPELDLPENKLGNRDPDGLVALLRDIIPRRSAIIFCPTKQNCENVCALLTRLVPKSLCDMHTRERQLSVVALNEESDGKLSPTLRRGVLCGVAYHHSGLTADERQIIENAFQDGIIRILCSTSTLAAGVNLPARRVIIKSALIGREPLKKTQYLQMIGRAGRAGFDCKGEAITIVHRGMEEKNFRAMLSAPLMACKSAFSDKSILSSFIFDLISLKIANSLEEIEGILKMTLYGIQSGSTQSDINECLLELMNRKMIRQNSDAEYIVTTLGDAAFTANITPIAALSISESLIENLSMGIVLSSHFHLIYTIVPFDIYIDVDWDIYYEEYRALSSSEHRLLDTMGVEEKHLVKYFLQRPKLPAGDSALRLYLTFMMKRIWSEESIWSVAERFHVSRGWLQSTLQSTCSQASSIARFSEKVPQLWPLKHLLPDLVQRLRDCCQQELIPLLAIDGVKRARARMLYDAGFKTPGAIASAEPSKLVSVVEHLNKRQAAKMISSAQMLVRDQIAEKVEEIEQMGIAVPQLCSQLMP